MTFEERFEQDYNNVEKLDTLVYDIVFSTHDYNLLSQIDNRITKLKG
jgi:hypothetical protein|tara:strand:- start:996 stop:1136 length:141 start_codon:yes stop_codon:yes gene_type:complete